MSSPTTKRTYKKKSTVDTASKTLSDLSVKGTVSSPIKEFKTTPTHFFGMSRRNPVDTDCPELDHRYIDTNGNIEVVSRIIANGKFPPLLIGDTGTGKTECLKHIAHELGMGLIRVNHTVRSEPEDIIGAWIADAEGKPTMSRGPLVEALEEGKIYYADEISAAKPGVLMAYQSVLEVGGTITLTIGKNKQIIKRHPDFRFVAAMNPIVYAGSNEMSAATFNRFLAIQFDYPTKAQEIEILRSVYPHLSVDVATALVSLGNKSRAGRTADRLTNYIISTRDLIKIAYANIELGLPWLKAAELVVLNAVKELSPEQLSTYQSLVNMHMAGLS